MAKRSRTAVLKRQREARKAEKQAMKREKREERGEAPVRNEVVATADDLAGYGFSEDEEPSADSADPPPAGHGTEGLRSPANAARSIGPRGNNQWPKNL